MRLIILHLVLLLSFSAQGQITIYGRVVNRDFEPIARADIGTIDGCHTRTDASGCFTLTVAPWDVVYYGGDRKIVTPKAAVQEINFIDFTGTDERGNVICAAPQRRLELGFRIDRRYVSREEFTARYARGEVHSYRIYEGFPPTADYPDGEIAPVEVKRKGFWHRRKKQYIDSRRPPSEQINAVIDGNTKS
jgi:hypothetical protein